MFRKLHFQLTVYNAAILIAFLFLFSLGAFFIMSKIVFARADFGLRGAAYRVNDLYELPPANHIREERGANGLKPSFPPPRDNFFEKLVIKGERDKYAFEYYFILRDSYLNVTASTEQDNSIISKSRKYAEKVMQNKQPHYANLVAEEGNVRLLTMAVDYNGQKGIVQVYTNINREVIFLSNLMTILIVLGLLSMIILVTIGWVLAGKSLIPIKKAWEKQKDFVADASHELRTPLTVIQTSLEVLLANRGKTINENIQWLNNIQAESEIMAKLVSDLLFIARIDAGEVEIEKKVMDLSQIAKNSVLEMAPLFSSKKINLEKKIEENIKFIGDELKIKQLLRILLDNAYKYTPEGGNVLFQLNIEHENICIKVTDSGIGISDEDKERIFDRFYRADKARSREQGGFGLGLSIANWIVKEHSGKIKVESKPGEGTSFTVIFPRS